MKKSIKITAENSIVDFLNDIYIEDKEEIKALLKKAEIQSACTILDLFRSFIELNIFTENRTGISIKEPLEYLKKMSNYSITGFRAGEILRNYIIAKRIFDK